MSSSPDAGTPSGRRFVPMAGVSVPDVALASLPGRTAEVRDGGDSAVRPAVGTPAAPCGSQASPTRGHTGAQRGSEKAPSTAGLDSVLHGAAAARAVPARLTADLRSVPFLRPDGMDPRLVDPTLVQIFEEQAAAVRAEARAAGYAAGYSAGYAAAAATVRDEVEARAREQAAALQALAGRVCAVLAAVEHAAQQLAVRQVPLVDQIAEELAAAALVLAEAVVGRELALADDAGVAALRRALAAAPAAGDAEVRLHPSAVAAVRDVLGTVPEAAGRRVTIIPDPALAPGDAVADCGDLHVDARIGAALRRAGEALGR